jgi:endonuclease-3 related protein
MPPLTELCAYYEALRGYSAGNALERFESRPPFERALAVLVGFGKAERVLGNLCGCLPAGAELTPAALAGLSDPILEKALRPAGFAGNKIQKVRGLAKVMAQGAAAGDAPALGRELVSMRGIGRESADAVLLHALDYPVFAVNAQTYRLLKRHGFVGEEAAYAEMQELFHAVLPEEIKVYKEYYHLIRQVAEDFCRAAKPACAGCPLEGYMEYEPDS